MFPTENTFEKGSTIYELYKMIATDYKLKYLLINSKGIKDHLIRCMHEAKFYPFLIKYIDEYLKLYPEVIKNDKKSLFIKAVLLNNEEIIDLLIKHGGNKNESLIAFCLVPGKEKTVKLILDHGIDVNSQNENGNTALMHSILYYSETNIKNLLEYGANIEIENEDKDNAIILAFRWCRYDAIDILLPSRKKFFEIMNKNQITKRKVWRVKRGDFKNVQLTLNSFFEVLIKF